MDRHPFFMKSTPDSNAVLDPLTEGLQKLKYDPNENTADELASNYKEDGNFYMKHKKYRMAILCYTEGIKSKCKDIELNAMLYNNRSAAHFFLQNYRTALFDAEMALNLKADYIKAKIRAAQCSYITNKFELCFKYCDELLFEDSDNKVLIELRKNCQIKKNQINRDERKKIAEEKRKLFLSTTLMNEIRKRKIKFEELDDLTDLTLDILQPNLPPISDFPVSLTEKNTLQWPLVFCYPEFLKADFQQQMNEDIV